MDIDTTQPWGIAIDYAGRATLAEAGHTIHINITDDSLSNIIEPDSMTGRYPTVSVTAQFTETGGNGVVLRGYGRVSISPTGTDPVTPDRTAAQTAVTTAVADFQANTAKYAALCATWTSPSTPDPETDTEAATTT